MKEKLLVTGASGQLGSEINYLSKNYPEMDFVFTDQDTLDITNLNALASFVSQHNITVLINCAAYTNVDKAEVEEKLAENINAFAVKNLVSVSEKLNLKLIHISTDYVFDGTAFSPISESDETKPLGVYGVTKQKGEAYIMSSNCVYAILRTSWLYSSFGNNFLKTIERLATEKEELTIIGDQVGTPTYARDLANAILTIVPKLTLLTSGVYHFSNEGVASWYDFAKEIVSELHLTCNVKSIETKEYKTLAKRPSYSVMNKTKIKNTFGLEIPYWRESLKECINSTNT